MLQMGKNRSERHPNADVCNDPSLDIYYRTKSTTILVQTTEFGRCINVYLDSVKYLITSGKPINVSPPAPLTSPLSNDIYYHAGMVVSVRVALFQSCSPLLY